MTATALGAGRTAPKASHVVAVTLGNALAWYDFLSYAFFAAQIGRALFPKGAEGAQLLASLATFGAGFLMRPVGALVIGRYADRVGRRPAMMITFVMLGVAMAGLALTPSYAQIGAFAPALAVVFRLMQGFGVGGELGASTAYLAEAAPPERRGLYISMQFMGQDAVGVVAAGLGFLLSLQLSAAQLDAWGWRAVFLVGVLIVPFGLLMRSTLPETLHAEDALLPAEGPTGLSVRRLVALGFVMIGFGSLVSYVLNYFTTYASETLKMAAALAFGAQIASSLASMISDPLGGWMSDKLGRKPVMFWSTLATVLLAIPAYVLIARFRTAPVLLGLAFTLSIIYGVGTNAVLVAVCEAMPKRQRSVALGLAYSLGVALLGGSSQFMVAWLTRLTGSPLAPAWYLTAGAVPIMIAILMMPETAPIKLRKR